MTVLEVLYRAPQCQWPGEPVAGERRKGQGDVQHYLIVESTKGSQATPKIYFWKKSQVPFAQKHMVCIIWHPLFFLSSSLFSFKRLLTISHTAPVSHSSSPSYLLFQHVDSKLSGCKSEGIENMVERHKMLPALVPRQSASRISQAHDLRDHKNHNLTQITASPEVRQGTYFYCQNTFAIHNVAQRPSTVTHIHARTHALQAPQLDTKAVRWRVSDAH
jgi:hypothetical protein